MSTITLSSPAPASKAVPARPGVRPARRTVRARGPVARPGRAMPAPRRHPDRRGLVRSCRVGPAAGSTIWRLTDRGIAVVLVLAAMIVMAAVTVIGLTAWQVTGPDHQASSTSAVNSR